MIGMLVMFPSQRKKNKGLPCRPSRNPAVPKEKKLKGMLVDILKIKKKKSAIKAHTVTFIIIVPLLH